MDMNEDTDNFLGGPEGQSEKTKLFFRLFVAHSNAIYRYILMLLPNVDDAEDIFQETAAVMLENFSKFTPGSNFIAWGVSIAHNKIVDFRRRRRKTRILFEDDLFERFAQSANKTSDAKEDYLQALRSCLAKLKSADRMLVALKYEKGITTKKVAEMTGRSLQGIYKTMARIHYLLQYCIRRKLDAGAAR